MEKTKLVQTLKSLGQIELRAFDRFLHSPYFNLRNDVQQIFTALKPYLESQKMMPDRQTIFTEAFPDKNLPENEKDLTMTYLVRLLEKFLQLEQIKLHPALEDWLYIKALNQHNLKQESEKAINKAFQHLESNPLRNAAYHEHQYRLRYEQSRQSREKPEENARQLKELNQYLNSMLVTMWLRQACLLLSEKAVYNMKLDTRFLPEIFEWVETDDHLSIPAVSTYYYACKMLMTDAESWFLNLKNSLVLFTDQFPPEELFDLHLMAINYCVRQLNAGNEQYFQSVFELYKSGLESRTLLNNGILTPLTYYNIVISGLKVNALDWVAWFIPQYKNNLERTYRDSAYSFNMARLHYAKHEYGDALLLLQKANYRDLLTNLAAKTLLLKIYYEQGEYEVLASHLEAMTHYLRRKRVIGYHRENYLNIIRVTKRIISVQTSKAAFEQLRNFIESIDPLTEKKWFLEVIGK